MEKGGEGNGSQDSHQQKGAEGRVVVMGRLGLAHEEGGIRRHLCQRDVKRINFFFLKFRNKGSQNKLTNYIQKNIIGETYGVKKRQKKHRDALNI